MKKVLVFFLVMSQATTAFAVCEHERSKRDHFKSLCDAASGASAVGAVVGGIAIPVIGGLIFGGIFGGGAIAACGERDAWQGKLEQCERNVLAEQEARNQAEAERQRRILEVNSRFDRLENEAREAFRERIRLFGINLLEQGRLDHLEYRIEEEQRNQRQVLEAQLRELEERRQAELHGI